MNADGTVVCEADNSATYTAGTGLSLSGGGQFSVNTSVVQARVSGTCAVGSTVRAINADGTVVCQADAVTGRASAPAPNGIYTLDSDGVVGCHTSMTIGADGLGLISYLDATNFDLKVAHCNDALCSSATTYAVDSTGDMGYFTSITIGADGLGLISYYDFTNDDLKVAHLSSAYGVPYLRRR